MRSVTSCFNSTLYHKNMTRFWPIWSLYTLIYIFAMPMQVLIQGDSSSYPQAERIHDTLWDFAQSVAPMMFLPFLFGLFIAMAVFSYLYSRRSACMIHALPISRKSLYFTGYLSGLSMLVIPNLVILGLTLSASLCRGIWEPAPVLGWFVAQSCAGVFFFSFACFCAMFTGNLFALPVFYGLLNFLVVGVGSLLMPILSSLLYGFQSYSTAVTDGALWFTPYVRMAEVGITESIREYDPIYEYWETVGYKIVNLEVFAIYLVAAVVIALLGYCVYLRYETERAGDVVAEIRVHPLFRYGVALCGGLAMGLMNTVLMGFDEDSTSVLLTLSVLWGIISYIIAEMFLQKSFKVIQKAWRGALIFGFALIALFACIALDVVGYSKNVPQLEDIQSAYLRVGTYNDNYADDVTDPQVLQQILELHQAIAETGQHTWGESTETETEATVYITYTLEDGGTMSRYYNVRYSLGDLAVEGTVTQRANAILENPAFLDPAQGLGNVNPSAITYMRVDDFWDAEAGNTSGSAISHLADRQLVFDALKEDYAQGNWGTPYLFNNEDYQRYTASRYTANLQIEYEYYMDDTGAAIDREIPPTATAYYGEYLSFELNPDCIHTIAALYAVGVLDENNYLITSSEGELLLDW